MDLFTPTSHNLMHNEKDCCCVKVQTQTVVFLSMCWRCSRFVTLDVWTFGDLEMSERLYLFRFCFYNVSITEEEVSIRCVCLIQNLCCHKHTIVKFLLILGYTFWGRNSGGNGARINSDSIGSLEMKLRMCLLSDPECSYSLQPTGLKRVLSFFHNPTAHCGKHL